MKKRNAQERRQEIAGRLVSEGKITVSELAGQYAVSTETIRKDMIWLEENGLAKKGYGGAVAATALTERSFLEKSIRNRQGKANVAKKAAEFVKDGDVLLLDSGSTVLSLAKQLVLKRDITVFTNSLKAAQHLVDHGVRVYLPGGEVRSTSNALTGGWTLRAFKEIRADLAILGTSGVKGRGGPCVESMEEAEVKRAMMASARKTMVLADASKGDCDALVQFADWEDVDWFITEETIGREALEWIREKTTVLFC
ncbi:MAG TPA: DeoR/GlpR family DNA-binding transcription regulator [Feifaniaceae bacterium]|nr:DeoR/GlpR family DNA-binding transcription regulator [Feifaniaceae bacterium]